MVRGGIHEMIVFIAQALFFAQLLFSAQVAACAQLMLMRKRYSCASTVSTQAILSALTRVFRIPVQEAGRQPKI